MQDFGIGDTGKMRDVAVTNPEKLHPSSGDDQRTRYAALVRGAASGDALAMEELLMKAQEAAFRFSLIVCGHPEDAEDVMQDALLKTFRHVGRIRQPDAFRTWLYRTVQNACLMKRRRRVNEPTVHLSLDAPSGHDGAGAHQVADTSRPADQQLTDEWLSGRLRQALAALSPPHRAIVVLREIEGLSTREVAQVMKISEANVKTRLHRARAQLRAHLGPP